MDKNLNLSLKSTMQRLLTFLFAVLMLAPCYSQEKKFPEIKPYVRVYANYHGGLTEDYQKTAFDLTRAYIGTKFKLDENFSGNVTIDFGDPGVGKLERAAYVKAAYLKYAKSNFSFEFGLIGMKQFKEQEKFTGHRYIYKTIQDEYKFGSSADMGISAAYKFSNFLSADITFSNGEGYKQLQADRAFKSALGITIKPSKKFIIREYFDHLHAYGQQITWSTFAGFRGEKLRIGGEYALQWGHKNAEDRDLSGISLFGSYDFNKKWQYFIRYDNLSSNTLEGETDAWNIGKDGDFVTNGLQYTAMNKIKLALNYRIMANAEDEKGTYHILYMNLLFEL